MKKINKIILFSSHSFAYGWKWYFIQNKNVEHRWYAIVKTRNARQKQVLQVDALIIKKEN